MQGIDEKHLSEIALKIKKLLALSESPNENEARFAIEKAQELLEKYNITLTDVEIQTAEMIHVEFNVYKAHSNGQFKEGDYYKEIPGWVSSILRIIQKYFYIKVVCGNKGHMHFLGAKADVQCAQYVFEYLIRVVRKNRNDYVNKIKKETDAQDMRTLRDIGYSYTEGMIKGISEQLRNQKSERPVSKTVTGTDLVVVKGEALNIYLNQVFPNLGLKGESRTSLSLQSSAFNTGIYDGRNVSINRGVGSSFRGQLAIGHK